MSEENIKQKLIYNLSLQNDVFKCAKLLKSNDNI